MVTVSAINIFMTVGTVAGIIGGFFFSDYLSQKTEKGRLEAGQGNMIIGACIFIGATLGWLVQFIWTSI
jgi:hypothetical protein